MSFRREKTSLLIRRSRYCRPVRHKEDPDERHCPDAGPAEEVKKAGLPPALELSAPLAHFNPYSSLSIDICRWQIKRQPGGVRITEFLRQQKLPLNIEKAGVLSNEMDPYCSH